MARIPPTKRSAQDISRIMARVRSRNTSPEIAFRKALWAEGLRYRVHDITLPGKPDVVVSGKRLAIFVDGDYWHGGQWVRRGLSRLEDQFPATPSKSYWLKKIRRNMERDCAATAALFRDGWTVLRFWESDIKRHLADCVGITLEAVRTPPAPAPFANLPEKTFLSVSPFTNETRQALEAQGWKPLLVAGKCPWDTIDALTLRGYPVSLVLASSNHNPGGVDGRRQVYKRSEPEELLRFLGLAHATQAPLCLYEAPSISSLDPLAQHAQLSLQESGYATDHFVLNRRSFVLGVRRPAERPLTTKADPGESGARSRGQDRDASGSLDSGWISRLFGDHEDLPDALDSTLAVIAERALNPLVNELIHRRVRFCLIFGTRWGRLLGTD